MLRMSLFWQMFLAFGLLIVLSLGVLGGVIGAWEESQSLKQTEDRLRDKAVMVREIVRGQTLEELRKQVDRIRGETQTRITLIAADGRVLVESEQDPEKLADHSTRPEIIAANEDLFGVATRFSMTEKKNMMYVAVRVSESTAPSEIAFARVALPLEKVQGQATQLRNLVWSSAGGIALLALFLAWTLARRLVQPVHELTSGVKQIAGGEFGQKVYLDRTDELGQLAGAFNNMSAQLATQFAQLDEDRQQLRAVLGSMVEGVIAIDVRQTILFANDCAGQMLGFPFRMAAGRKLWEVVRQHDVQDLVRTILRTPRGEPSKLEFTDLSGKSLMMHVAQLPGEPTRGAVLVFHDMTELRRLEHLRQDFVANVSHELKTPLSVITACVETLIEGGVDDVENRGRFLGQVHEQTQRLHALILDLLSLARIESREQVWSFQALVIADLAQVCIERHQARAEPKKQTLVLEPPADNPDLDVWADEEALSEILDNLIDNAVKYTPEGGTIRLRWYSDGDWRVIEVQDTGIGIPAADLPRIFERFYRVDKARSRELGGTGLGLAIVKHLVQAMEGVISAGSAPGQGSTFTIRLPRPPAGASTAGTVPALAGMDGD